MPNTSVYKFIRPIVVICSVLGCFCATNITAEESLELKFKLLSFPLAIYFFQGFLNLYILSETVRYYSSLDDISLAIYDVMILAYHNVWMIYQLLGSKQVIKSIQTVDRLRENILSSNIYLNSKLTNPIVFNSVICILLIIGHFTAFLLHIYLHKPREGVFLNFVYFMLVMSFVLRQVALYSCVYYSCALAVYDTVQVWRCNSKVKPLQTGFIHEFYKLLVTQVQLLNEIDQLLQNHILCFLLNRLISLAIQSIHYIDLESAVLLTMISRLEWVVIIGFLSLSMSLASEEYKKLEEEVFLLSNENFTKRNYFKFTALGIEYLIMLVQNVDMLRTLHGLTPDLIIKTR